MAAFIGYSFGLLEPGATVGVYLHGFPANQFAGIDVRAQRSPSFPTAFQPVIDVEAKTMAEHVDGTLAHTIIVANKSVSHGAAPKPVVTIAVSLEPLS
jgi:hypothetical protein